VQKRETLLKAGRAIKTDRLFSSIILWGPPGTEKTTLAMIIAEATERLARVAGGDARIALNALKLAVESTPPSPDGVIRIDLVIAQDSIQRRAMRYDKAGDEHYDTFHAFIPQRQRAIRWTPISRPWPRQSSSKGG